MKGELELEEAQGRRPEGGGQGQKPGNRDSATPAQPAAHPCQGSCAPAQARLAFPGPELSRPARGERASPGGQGVSNTHTSL